MTERNYNPKQKEKKAMEKPKEIKKKKIEAVKPLENEVSKEKVIEEKKKDSNKKEIVEKKIKKIEAVVNAKSVPISTKYAIEICRFIRGKEIGASIIYLEKVLIKKKAIPMRGEYGHKKGKRMAGGKYPKLATEHFIKLLKSLSANAISNGVENPVIVEAVSNMASRPLGRFGRWKRKRTHIKLVAKSKGRKK